MVKAAKIIEPVPQKPKVDNRKGLQEVHPLFGIRKPEKPKK